MKDRTLLLSIIALLLGQVICSKSDAFKTFEEICIENGFSVEQYTLTTKDGYILSLYRIPGKLSEPKDVRKPVVFMMHSQNWDMTQWVANSADRANAFILSNAGFDVWMGNKRGSKYSLGHVSLSTKDLDYWEFYQEHMGTIDVPTFIDFVLDQTGLEQLTYIGHSEGTTQMFMGTSLMPEYFGEKVNLYVALAPVTNLQSYTQQGGFQLKLANHINVLSFLIKHVFHYFDTFKPITAVQETLVGFCSKFEKLCNEKLMSKMITPGVDNFDRSAYYIANMPSGASYRTFLYYGMTIASGNFAQWDYGRDANWALYGQADPPRIPLEDIQVPVAIFSGSIDTASTPQDVAWLSGQLGDKVIFQKEYLLEHWSFSIAEDMTWFSEDCVNLIKEYNII